MDYQSWFIVHQSNNTLFRISRSLLILTMCSVCPSFCPPFRPPFVLLPSFFTPRVCVLCAYCVYCCTSLVYTTVVVQQVEILKEHAVDSLINRLENMINVGYMVIRQLSDQSKYQLVCKPTLTHPVVCCCVKSVENWSQSFEYTVVVVCCGENISAKSSEPIFVPLIRT